MRRTPSKPSWWKLSVPEWEWYCFRQKLDRQEEPVVEHVVPEVPPWPGLDGAPPEVVPETKAQKAKRRDVPMKGLPWGCKTVGEYGKEFRRRQAQAAARNAESVDPVLRKRPTSLPRGKVPG